MSFSEWDSYNLDEVYDISSGLSKSRKEFGFGYPFVTFKDVFYNFFIPEELTELANTSDKERLKCSVERGDVFLTRTSETLNELGQSSVALKTYPNATFNGFTKRLRSNGIANILPEYAGYYFRSPHFRAEVTSMATMTTRASLNNDILSRLKIVVPPLREQKSIAKILFSLDQKIEVNNQINENLQSISQLLFKHWFVDFEFPNEEGNPYQSSGGEMMESEIGMIPKGWQVGELNEIINISSGKRPKNRSSLKDEVFRFPLVGASSIMGYTSEYNYDDVILVIGRVGTHGIIQNFKTKIWASDNTLIIKPRYYEFVRHLLSRIDYKALNRGSTQPLITQTDIKNQKIILPQSSVLVDYELSVKVLADLVYNNNLENGQLTKLRDTLLQKLMNGEIDVSNIEINE